MSRPFVINRQLAGIYADLLEDLKTVLTSIDMADYDAFPNTQANLYRVMSKYDTFPVFFDDIYHERYGGQSR